MATHIRVYSKDGTFRGLLPDHARLRQQQVLNDAGTLTFDYPVVGHNAALLNTDEALLTLLTDGVESEEWYRLDDDIEQVAGPTRNRVIKVTATGMLVVLDDAVIYPRGHKPGQNPNGMNPEVEFKNATAGAILLELIQAAKARGALTDVKTNFTATHDSAGKAWAKAHNVTYKVGPSYLKVVRDMVDDGWADVRMQRDVLEVYNPDTELARDLGGQVIIRTAQQVKEGPRKRSRRGIKTVMLGVGSAEEKSLVEVADSAAQTKWGRREASTSDGRMTTNGSLRVMAQDQLKTLTDAKEGFTLKIAVDPPPNERWPIPGRDFRPGDHIRWEGMRRSPTELEPLRVRTISFGWEDATAPRDCELELNDVFVEGTIRTKRRLDAITSGTTSTSTSPAPVVTTPATPTSVPKPPTNVTLSPHLYAHYETHYVGVLVSWTPTTENTDGTSYLDHAAYYVEWQVNRSGQWNGLGTMVDGGGASIWLDMQPQGALFKARVRARDTQGHYSKWVESDEIALPTDDTPPPLPSMPVLEHAGGKFLRMVWDGKAADGSPMPADFHRLDIAFSTDPETTTPVNAQRWEGGALFAVPDYGVDYYVRIRAVDRMGNTSGWTAPATAKASPLVSDDVFLDALDAAMTRIKNGERIDLSGISLGDKLDDVEDQINDAEQALSGPGGLTERLTTAEERLNNAGDLVVETGVTLSQKLTTLAEDIGQANEDLHGDGGLVDRLAQAELELDNAGDLLVEPGVTLAQKLASNLARADEAVRGLPVRSTTAPTAADGKDRPAGATWQQVNASGKQISYWRWDGTTWEALPLDPTIIPVIQIGTGTAGDLDISRLTVTDANLKTAVVDQLWGDVVRSRKITTDMLLVGDFTNLVDNPLLTDDGAGWEKSGDPSQAAVVDTIGGPGLAWRLTAHGAYISVTNTNRATCTPGDRFHLACRVQNQTNATANVRVLWNDHTGAYLTYTDLGVPAGQSWADHSREVTAPAGAYQAQVRLIIGTTATSGHVWYSKPVLRRKASGELLVDGSVEAKHITASETLSAKVAEFLEVDVSQLRVTDGATMNEAVIDELWTEVVRSRKITTDMLIVGGGENSIVDPYFLNAELRAERSNRSGFSGAAWSTDAGEYRYGGTGLVTTATKNFHFYPGIVPANGLYHPDVMIPVQAREVWRIRIPVYTEGGGARITYRRLNVDGTTNYSVATGSAFDTAAAGTRRTIEARLTVPAGVTHIVPAVQFEAATTAAYVYAGAHMARATDASLMVDGSVEARHITASESLSAKVGEFLTVRTDQLTVTGTAGMDQAVIDELWTEVVRSRKITTDMLLVATPDNIIADPHFQDDAITAWRISQASAGTWWAGRDETAGINYIATNPLEHPDGVTAYLPVTYGGVEVVPGATYMLEYMVWNSATPAGSVAYFQTTASGTAAVQWASSFTYPDGSGRDRWIRVRRSFTVSPDTSGNVVALWVGVWHAQTNDQFRVARPVVTRMAGGELIVDGSVKARHVDTNELTADDGFIANLRTTFLKSDVFEGKLFTGGEFVGTYVRAGGATSGEPYAALTPNANHISQAGVQFGGDNSANRVAVLFAADRAGSGQWNPYDTVLMGSEITRNSSGRADLQLHEGGDFFLGQHWGSYDWYGVSKRGRTVEFLGQMPIAVHPHSQWGYLRVSHGTLAARSRAEWNITWNAPPPTGTRKPIVTAEAGVWPGIPSAGSITASGFVVRVGNPWDVSISAYAQVWGLWNG